MNASSNHAQALHKGLNSTAAFKKSKITSGLTVLKGPVKKTKATKSRRNMHTTTGSELVSSNLDYGYYRPIPRIPSTYSENICPPLRVDISIPYIYPEGWTYIYIRIPTVDGIEFFVSLCFFIFLQIIKCRMSANTPRRAFLRCSLLNCKKNPTNFQYYCYFISGETKLLAMVLKHSTVVWLVVTSLLWRMRATVGEEMDWANVAGHLLSRSCMYGFGISGFYSVYDLAKKDRLWRVHCSRIGFKGGDFCWWTCEYISVFIYTSSRSKFHDF